MEILFAEFNSPHQSEVSFEQKLYHTLRAIDSSLLSDYLEAFGLPLERRPLGIQLKDFADRLSEADFLSYLLEHPLSSSEFSALEIQVLYNAAIAPAHSSDQLPA